MNCVEGTLTEYWVEVVKEEEKKERSKEKYR